MKRLFPLEKAISIAGACAFIAACGTGGQSVPSTPPAESGAAEASRAFTEPLASTAAVATYKGCNVFASGDYYNADITQATVDAHSGDYLKSLTATDDTGFYGSSGLEPVNVASANTARYTVHPKVSYHSFPVPYPWSSSFDIEAGGDAHLVVVLVAPPSCHLYEAYSASFSSNALWAYSGANWDLSQPYKVVSSSAMASALPLFAGSVRHEDIASGIHHALNFSVYSQSICNCFTAPAGNTDGLSYAGPSTSYELPYGAHLRLKASFDDSHFGTQSKAIAEAMKHYGIYVADTGGHYRNNNAVYLANPTDGGNWDHNDLSSLGNLRFADFDVLKVGAITHR